jgi:hypothetical protein
MKTGWSRAEILGLSPAEFNHYLEVIITAKADQ